MFVMLSSERIAENSYEDKGNEEECSNLQEAATCDSGTKWPSECLRRTDDANAEERDEANA
jgi:hypothetical protein